jgi:LacI family transcriptional regulator
MPSKQLSEFNSGAITIFDVAERAGVSYGTVSRVINQNPHVRPETRERVLLAMQELGYVVNRQARSLAGGRSLMIGVLVPDLGTGYIGEIMRGIDAEISRAGYDLVLYTTHREEMKEAGYVTSLTHGAAEGLLIVLPRNPGAYLETLRAHNFPFVLIDHQGINDQGPAVGATNWQGAFNATEYLIKLGHRRLGFITGTMDLGCSRDRLAGYEAALRMHHVPYRAEYIYYGDFFQPSGFIGAQALLSQPDRPTAIFASNDVMAVGVMEAVRVQGLRVPEDISVIGFDDIPQSTLLYPPLTTVRQPLEKMGRVATQMLLDVLNHPEKKVNRIELPTELVERGSALSPKAGAG